MAEFIYGKQAYQEIKDVLNNNVRIKHDFNLFNRGRV
jgi:hypothetical protein